MKMSVASINPPAKKSYGGLIGLIVFIAAACLFGWSIWNVIQIASEDAQANDITEDMQQYTSAESSAGEDYIGASYASRQEKASIDDQGNYVTDDGDIVIPANSDEDAFTVDFAGLTAVNPDVKGWIRVPGTNISHAIVQGGDNNYYLKHGPDGTSNRAGSIFMEKNNMSDFSDGNTILYGHRMNNGTMFAQLHNFEDPDFVASHPFFYVTTPDGVDHKYKIYDVSHVSYEMTDPAFQTLFMDEQELNQWKSSPAGSTNYYYETPLEGAVVTLMTCVKNDGALRFVVKGYEVA